MNRHAESSTTRTAFVVFNAQVLGEGKRASGSRAFWPTRPRRSDGYRRPSHHGAAAYAEPGVGKRNRAANLSAIARANVGESVQSVLTGSGMTMPSASRRFRSCAITVGIRHVGITLLEFCG